MIPITLTMKILGFEARGTLISKSRKWCEKVKKWISELVDRVRVLGSTPYFEDFEYS